ncbi:hypothetical protein F5887DRAFT_1281283 [Amanita rubescens]|nr:hypothetical protein F5887DRAFT_1281283 [Amanita rubescens]
MRFFSRGKANTTEQEKLLHGGLPPSFRPSMITPSIANPSIASQGTYLANASQHANEYLANASHDVHQALAHKLSSMRDMAPVRIICRDWDDGVIFDWYGRQTYTTITKLELRKERDHFKHEYIVIYLDNGWVHRIDRRPIKGPNFEPISKEGCEAEDSLTPVSNADLEVIRSETDAEITLEFGSNKPDLYNVIAVAVAIRLDPRTKNYTLQQYNCYFVARSIITLVTRHCLLQSSPTYDLRWDRVTESTILTHVFDGNWNKLETLLKAALIPVLGHLIWDIVKEDAGTRIEKRKDWDRLKDIVNKVIRDEVERCDIVLAGDEIPKAVTEWIIEATQVTLWYGNLQQSFSEPQFSNKYETTASCSLNETVKPQLEAHLPGNMIQGVSVILPERLINRIPSSALARLPPELLARVPIKVLEKLPDDLLAKLPNDLLRGAPKEFLQNLPIHIFSRMRDAMVLTLPDDLGLVPPTLLEVAFLRMQNLLDKPDDNPDRKHALQLLRRLPEDYSVKLSPEHIAMCEEIKEEETSSAEPTIPVQHQAMPDVKRHTLFRRIKKKWDNRSFLGFLIRIAPLPVLKRVPPFVMDLLPLSSIRSIPKSALERIPAEYMAKMTDHCFERLPRELLERLPETLLSKLPRPTLERLPTSLLERLPVELVRNIPSDVLENIPEDLTDLLRQAIKSNVFEGDELKQELREQVKVILRRTLIASSGELPTGLIRAFIKIDTKQKNDGKLDKHEELQTHILDMVREHSKKVAQVQPLLGMSEETVYNGLRHTTEEIWRVDTEATMHFFSRGKTDTKEQDKLFHGGLPPSFRPSMATPSIANPSIASQGTYLANASQHANEYLANASHDVHQALAHKLSSMRDMAPVRITCRDWDDGRIFDWYRMQTYTTITKLELRKERDHFKHEYIVIYLDNGWVHRIDRRPVKGPNFEPISKEGCEAEDSLTPVSDADLEVIHSETDAEIILEFGSNKPDLYNVIAVAVAIHLDPRTKNYTLQQYNCYFVARSVIALVTRHCLLQSSPTNYLRWDRVTESMILTHVFDGNWNKLGTLLKAAMIPVLENLIWDVVKEDAGTRIKKRKDWDRLKDIVNEVIRDEVERCNIVLAGNEIPKAVTEWIIQATEMTLWHGNLQQSFSEPQFSNKYETTASCSLNETVKPQLEAHLPGNMIQGVSVILPERLINRIPPSALARLPPELLARVPIKVLEKLPDDLLAKLPNDLLRGAPKEFLQNLPIHIFSRMRDAMVLTLPDDLGLVPPTLLEVALLRMQNLLDKPNDNPDRKHALQLLRRLPLAQLSPEYIAMREEIEEGITSPVNPTLPEQQSDQGAPHVKPPPLFRRINKRWDELSILGFLIRISPIVVLKHLPIIVMDAVPTSSIKSLPASAVERIPPEYIGRMSNHCFERLPQELLVKLSATVLSKLPRPTLERLPTSLLERLPVELVRNIPSDVLENIPEDLTDLLRQAIKSNVFEGDELKQELREQVKVILRQTLIASSGELPTGLIRAFIKVDAKQKNDGRLKTHEELQTRILDMVREHSKKVAQVQPLLGMSEEAVYNGLRHTTEEIWRVVRLHPSPSGSS